MPRAQKIDEVVFRDFSGGLNTRDAASELGKNEFPYSINVTVDERGAAKKRLGYENRFALALGTGKVTNLFYWATQDKLVSQIGTGMYLDNGASFHTWTTTARCGMAEFGGNLFMNHPVDGLKWYNGTSVTSVASAPKGNTLATWQNRLWAGEVGLARLWYSPIGDPTAAWPGTNWVDLKEKDSSALTCLSGASGLDISGRPGLLVFKQDSTYRVHDSATGAYTTVDASIGCGSNIGAVNAYGRTYVCSTRGIYFTDGLEPCKEASQLIENFFHKDQVNQARPDLFCAGRYQDRLYFSFPRAGETFNSVAIELHPTQNWVVPHTNAASCYASIGKNVLDLAMGSPTVDGRIWNSHKGGSDAGTDIASALQTKWEVPFGDNKARVRRTRVYGNGRFNATVYRDFELAQGGETLDVNLLGAAASYDSGFNYDAANSIYGPTAFITHLDFWSTGVYRAMSFYISETSSLTTSGRSILGATNVPEEGAWTLSHVSMQTIELGRY